MAALANIWATEYFLVMWIKLWLKMTSPTKIHNKKQFDPDSYLSSASDLDLLNSVNLYLYSTFISQSFS